MSDRDRPATLALLAEWAADRHGPEPALSGAGGVTTYEALREDVRTVARGLIGALGVAKGDRVALLSETRPEWTVAQLAAFEAGAVVVPVYPTAGEDETAWVLSDSGTSVVICENEAQAARVGALREAGRLPALRHVLLMAGMRVPDRSCTEDELLERAASVTAEDLCTIVYTSGTTGPPKGCLLTHGNLSYLHDSTGRLVGSGERGARTYLYLPLAHLLAQLVEFRSVVQGGELWFFGGRIENIVSELAEAQPTHLPSVPRLFEKVYATVRRAAESSAPDGRARFEEAIRLGNEVAELRESGQEPEGALRERYEAADARLYEPVRGIFGGRLSWAVSGAAPLSDGTRRFLRACGVTVYEGYGMTESGGVISLNHPGAHRSGTVGRPIPGCEVRIAEDGEILARSAGVFPGYHGNEAATREALDEDGWLHTGDLGRLDEDGYLVLTGRKKDLVITSGGKNLSPAEVEGLIEEAECVSHAVMVGDRRPYPVALVTVDPAATEGLDMAGIHARVGEAVAAANARVARPARIRAFAVLDEDFSVERGTLTPTLKVRRTRVTERYADRIESLYTAPPPAPVTSSPGPREG
ncbi:AMP-dependent synthetase/ligase [Streptomyces sp. NPDC048172]|uniref:AMP-dependent synthetase/ligase n=1 Tax=Streptomyces sp. NPDC048172 TaxID=3365505 RepID=UPI003721D1EE